MICIFTFELLFYALKVKKRAESEKIARCVLCVVQVAMWTLSILMMTFEYRRALGHVWYVHPLFWWFSISVYAADVTLWNTESHGQGAKSSLFLALSFVIATFLSLFLSVLSIVYPDDVPFERRGYIKTSEEDMKAMFSGRN